MTDDELREFEQHLLRDRPVPGAGFRGELRRGLMGTLRPRRARSRALSLCFAYAASGVLLLLTAVAGVAGVGPLSAG